MSSIAWPSMRKINPVKETDPSSTDAVCRKASVMGPVGVTVCLIGLINTIIKMQY